MPVFPEIDPRVTAASYDEVPSFIKRLIFEEAMRGAWGHHGILRHIMPQTAQKTCKIRQTAIFSIACNISVEKSYFLAVDCFLNKPNWHTCFKKLLLANLK
ncbi:hypothetical protein LP421_27850 [Rhizobium sp. RCAM05350]|nr:hypothetical protein LP421_27850 [Rhizobium sp. RCAM05350]